MYSTKIFAFVNFLQAYWEWTWDELMAYDVTASVKFVHDQTGQQKLHYVGHSLVNISALLLWLSFRELASGQL